VQRVSARVQKLAAVIAAISARGEEKRVLTDVETLRAFTRGSRERGFEIGCRAYFDDAKVEPQGARGRTYPENAPATVRSASRNAVDVDVAFGQHQDRRPTHGYEATREAAMTTFAKSWRRE
jgi:hypothetical protein